MPMSVILGSITDQLDDAIVNSANPSLLAGGGVCGAIHRTAGPELEKACRAIGRCEVSDAVITPAFGLPCKWVIHAVGPRWLGGGRGEPELLERCYESIFLLVASKGIRSVSLPSISTGIYHYPLDQAVQIAVSVARKHDRSDLKTTFVCFDGPTADAYWKAIEHR